MTSPQIPAITTESLDDYRTEQLGDAEQPRGALHEKNQRAVSDEARRAHGEIILNALKADLETLRNDRNNFYYDLRRVFTQLLKPKDLEDVLAVFDEKVARYLKKNADGTYEGLLPGLIRKYQERYERDVLAHITDVATRDELRTAMQEFFNELQAKEMSLIEKHRLGLEDTNRIFAAEWLGRRAEFNAKYRKKIDRANVGALSRINDDGPALKGFEMNPNAPNRGTITMRNPDDSDDYEDIYQTNDERSLIETHVKQTKGEDEGKPYHFERAGKTYRMTVAAGESTANKLEVAKRMIRQARVDHPRQRFINLTNLIPGIFDPSKKDDREALEALYVHAATYGFNEIKPGIEITDELKDRAHKAQVKFAEDNTTSPPDPSRLAEYFHEERESGERAYDGIPTMESATPPPPPARDFDVLMQSVRVATTAAETGFESTQQTEVQGAAEAANSVVVNANTELARLYAAEMITPEQQEEANVVIATLRTHADGLTQRTTLCELNRDLIVANSQAEAVLENTALTPDDKHTAAEAAEATATRCDAVLIDMSESVHEKNGSLKTSLDEKVAKLRTTETALRAGTIDEVEELDAISARVSSTLERVSAKPEAGHAIPKAELAKRRREAMAEIAATRRDLDRRYPAGIDDLAGVEESAKETYNTINKHLDSLADEANKIYKKQNRITETETEIETESEIESESEEDEHDLSVEPSDDEEEASSSVFETKETATEIESVSDDDLALEFSLEDNPEEFFSEDENNNSISASSDDDDDEDTANDKNEATLPLPSGDEENESDLMFDNSDDEASSVSKEQNTPQTEAGQAAASGSRRDSNSSTNDASASVKNESDSPVAQKQPGVTGQSNNAKAINENSPAAVPSSPLLKKASVRQKMSRTKQLNDENYALTKSQSADENKSESSNADVNKMFKLFHSKNRQRNTSSRDGVVPSSIRKGQKSNSDHFNELIERSSDDQSDALFDKKEIPGTSLTMKK